MRTSDFFRKRPDFFAKYSLFNREHAEKIMQHGDRDNRWIAEQLKDKFTEIAPDEYAYYVKNPLELVQQFDDEEKQFIEGAIKAIIDSRRRSEAAAAVKNAAEQVD